MLALVPLCALVNIVARSPTLEDRLLPLARAHRGRVALAVEHLVTGQRYSLDGDRPMPTASLIKVAVMAEAYQQVALGRVRLDELVTLRDQDKVPGSGILTDHFGAGARFPLGDAIHLMIAFSDNTATNLVLDRVGIAATTARMEAWGFPHTTIHHKAFRGSTTSVAPERTQRFGLGATTAREMVGLFSRLYAGDLVGPEASREMLRQLERCEDRQKLPRFLPAGTRVAHKTGSDDGVRTDAGILFTPAGPVAVAVLTADNHDRSWGPDNEGDRLCAEVGRVVYEHFDTP
jgi:beta-lactamase class A